MAGLVAGSHLARGIGATYYRLTIHGAVPRSGPVLLVANHPNSLIDPLLVMAAAGRPTRFLAKAPLFGDPKVGWLMRWSRSIPVYRQGDDPTQMSRNDEMFRAVHAALAAGSAVALFPEGISHSESAMVPLKTGAARIALGAAVAVGGDFPIVPVGLVFREKDRFRSAAHVVVAEPVAWHDLAACGSDDANAVRELTARIDTALRSVTHNLDTWRDAPVVETALAIWESERRLPMDPRQRAERHRRATAVLGEVRRVGDAEGEALAAEVVRHQRRLTRLGLVPADLYAGTGTRTAIRWAFNRLPVLMPLAAIVGAAGYLLFVIPFHLTGMIVARFRLERDTTSTWKLMVGGAVYGLWVLGVAVTGAVLGNAWTGALLLALLPAIGMVGLLVRERWRDSWRDARRWLLLRSRRTLGDSLREAQEALGSRLAQLLDRFPPSEGHPTAVGIID